MKRLQFTDTLLAIVLFFLISCGHKGNSNSSGKDSVNSSSGSDSPTETQNVGSSNYNPNSIPADTVKIKHDSARKEQRK
jgi:hypothetical protein